MRSSRLPQTATFHVITSRNFSCHSCYATVADLVGRPVRPGQHVLALTRRRARPHTQTLRSVGPFMYSTYQVAQRLPRGGEHHG